MMVDLRSLFEREKIMRREEVFTEQYIPEKILCRDKQIEQLVKSFIYSAKADAKIPTKVLLIGGTGSGKTAVTKYVMKQIENYFREKGEKFMWFYVSCKENPTEYLFALLLELGVRKERIKELRGYARDWHFVELKEEIEKCGRSITIVLDEIDQAKNIDDLLYYLTRGEFSYAVSLVCITNREDFLEKLDPRTISSFNPEKIYFPLYTIQELEIILRDRAEKGLDLSRVDDGVIELCASISGRERGDARRAIQLLRVATKLADENNKDRLTINEVYEAYSILDKLDLDFYLSKASYHCKILIYSLAELEAKGEKEDGRIYTPNLYDAYANNCRNLGLIPLTPRRISDLINDLEFMGLIRISEGYFGRGGRRRWISLNYSADTVLSLDSLKDIKKDLKPIE